MAQDLTTAPQRDTERARPVAVLVADDGRWALRTVVLPLLVVAAVAWAVTADMGSSGISMGAAAFVAGWLVMMVAMMLPAAAPVVGVYAMAARRGVVAAVPVFLSGYLAVWAVSALPAYAVSGAVSEPLADGAPWMSRLVAATLLVTGAYQLSPLKAACLRHCQSPMAFFLARRRSLASPRAAFAAGAGHGLRCLGCCWALMALLIVVGGMQLGWALVLAAVITVEKLGPRGLAVSRVTALAALALAAGLLVEPDLLGHLVVVESPMPTM